MRTSRTHQGLPNSSSSSTKCPSLSPLVSICSSSEVDVLLQQEKSGWFLDVDPASHFPTRFFCHCFSDWPLRSRLELRPLFFYFCPSWCAVKYFIPGAVTAVMVVAMRFSTKTTNIQNTLRILLLSHLHTTRWCKSGIISVFYFLTRSHVSGGLSM